MDDHIHMSLDLGSAHRPPAARRPNRAIATHSDIGCKREALVQARQRCMKKFGSARTGAAISEVKKELDAVNGAISGFNLYCMSRAKSALCIKEGD